MVGKRKSRKAATRPEARSYEHPQADVALRSDETQLELFGDPGHSIADQVLRAYEFRDVKELS